MSRIKARIYTLLERAEEGDQASRAVDIFLVVLILANTAAVILESMPELSVPYHRQFKAFETVSVIVFTLEYLLRVWSCTEGGYSPGWGRLRFVAKPMLLVDLIAILPFFLVLTGMDLRHVRLLRLVRLLRIAKLARYSTALRLLGRGCRARKEELLLTLLMGLFAMVLAATMMYFAEHAAQPEVFPSIPAALWWAVTTLTTVGYGDAYPVTLAGKVVGGIVQVLGVAVLAIPTGLLGASFLEQIQAHKAAGAPSRCPHCGGELQG